MRYFILSIGKLKKATLKALTALEPDIKKSYKLERRLHVLTAKVHRQPKGCETWDYFLEHDGYSIPVHFFKPDNLRKDFLLLYFHGGGWVTGGIENYMSACLSMAIGTGCMIASVDYRLAPEYKFPAAPEDCYAVAKEFFSGNIIDVNPDKIVLTGDSAGGNLAAVVSLMARDRCEFSPKQQILFYPSTYNDHSETSPFSSIRENGTGYILTSKRVCDVIELYRSSEEDLYNPYFAPLIADDLSSQPKTLIITAEYCPLRDEGEAYGQKLLEAGNYVKTVRIKDAIHGFLTLSPSLKYLNQSYRAINAFLARGNENEKKQSVFPIG